MNVLVLGAGGREHTLTWKLSQSNKIKALFVAPGNAGTATIATNVAIGVTNFEDIKRLVLKEEIDAVIVGPEVPLVEGIHDFFLKDAALAHVTVIGPQKLAATLEGSKEFAKEFMMRHNIPTASYQSFSSATLEEGYRFLESLTPPYVLKADGLAAGKGVLILSDIDEAKRELKTMLVDSKFGDASRTVVIEEFLDGIELSCFVLTDGEHYKILPMAKDYKRIGEGDTGLNTGGMGAISPVPFVDEGFRKKIEDSIVKPTMKGLKADEIPYVGFIFIGLIKVKGNEPKVIEYNVRMGDPETEVVIPRIKNDLVEVLQAITDKRLNEIELQIDDRAAATVIAVSGGYPEGYEKGKEIKGLDDVPEAIVFHAGTKELNGKVVSNGGRVLAITSYGEDFKEALEISYSSLEKIHFDGMYFRKDIGFDL
ncbi:MAG: phosphoribosylamine--glycine ligase [Bacteroidota bacterium]